MINFKKKFWFITIIFLFLSIYVKTFAVEKLDLNDIHIGRDDAPIKIIIYASLTCPHCASFHLKELPKIQEKYVNTNIANITFKDFPLDLAALNASKLLKCVKKNDKKKFLDEVFLKQSVWGSGTTIEEINQNLFKISSNHGIDEIDGGKCLLNEDVENSVLNSRIDAQKNYEINSTPRIIINGKKLEDAPNLKNIEKQINKEI